jgi:hypothetical protein
MRTFLFWLLAFVAAPANVELFRDDFSRFPPGLLSAPVGQLNGAIQEYHYLPHRGVPTAPWYNPITHNDSWVAGDEDGKSYLEQHLIHDQPERWQPLFVTGDPLWTSYTVAARVRPLSLAESAGIVFRYHTNHHYYAFTISGGKRARLALKSPFENKFRTVEWKELGTAEISYDVKQYHELKVENDGPKIRAYFDGKLIIEASDTEILNGRAGLTANIPTRFTDFVVSAPPATAQQIQTNIAARQSAAEVVEEIRYAQVGRGAQRAVRRSGWRWAIGHAHRAKHSTCARRCIRPHQLSDRREPRRQSVVANGTA